MAENKSASDKMSRRSLLLGSTAGFGAMLGTRHSGLAQAEPAWSLPMGLPGRIPGDGCYIRHGFACENIPYLPGWWHTGENWYLSEGDSAGAPVYAVASGDVVFAGSDYPGRVVIIQHEAALFSMYGHLDYNLLVAQGDRVGRGQQIGTVLFKTDGRSPSHLHFEVRTFLIHAEVNGDAPAYAYACGVQCPPGLGYWPMSDPRLPVQMGWRNPIHALYRRAFTTSAPAGAEVVVTSASAAGAAPLWSGPGTAESQIVDEIDLIPGERFSLRGAATGREATRQTSADAYQVWLEIEYGTGQTGWVQAASPTSEYVSSDGRPATVRLNLLISA